MRGVICDVCGALSDSDDPRERRGQLYVTKPLVGQSGDESEMLLRLLTGTRGGGPVDTYDFCGDCAVRLVAMLAQQRVSKV